MGKTLSQAVKSFSRLEKQVSKQASMALNKTAPHVRAFAAKEVTKYYTIKQSDAKKMMSITSKSSQSKLETVVHAESRLLTPYHFKYTPTSGITSGRKVKTSVTIKKGNKQILRHAFVAVVKGARNVFIRKNKSRSSMVSLRSVSLPQMIANEKVAVAINEDMDKFYEKEFVRAFNYMASKEGFK